MNGPVVLCILDGWGKRAEREANAIALANTPNWDRMIRQWPTGELECSGADVGLPDGQMGNSEVGHMNLGAGRIVWQDLPRINNAIADGSLAASEQLASYIAGLKASGGTCHLAGLVSPGGVHALDDHVVALSGIVSQAGVPVKIHAFLDGRDTPPRNAANDIPDFIAKISGMANVELATLCGRYYAMDRDKRWDRVALCYNLLVSGEGTPHDNPAGAISESYAADISDEFVQPVVLNDYAGMTDGDGILFANFRADRVREILSALIDPQFDGFKRSRIIRFAAQLGMVSYSDRLDTLCDAIFPPVLLSGTLSEVVSNAGRTQLRLAETEKYPHVSFFFNGGREEPFKDEKRILVPSPKVATYDLQPEMSALEVTDHLVDAINGQTTDLIIVNYANGDMVGHTGSLEAAITAVECLDDCLGRVENAILENNGRMLVTADHGNCEMMVDPEIGGPHTAHTLNPVPTVLVNHPQAGTTLADGRLADVAPTILELFGLTPPDEMTGRSLLRRSAA